MLSNNLFPFFLYTRLEANMNVKAKSVITWTWRWWQKFAGLWFMDFTVSPAVVFCFPFALDVKLGNRYCHKRIWSNCVEDYIELEAVLKVKIWISEILGVFLEKLFIHASFPLSFLSLFCVIIKKIRFPRKLFTSCYPSPPLIAFNEMLLESTFTSADNELYRMTMLNSKKNVFFMKIS